MATATAKQSSEGHEPPTNVLPAGQKPIRLPSEECEEKFHLSAATDVPLLDDVSAKRKELIARKEEGTASPKPQVLPKGSEAIPLPSEECEEKFHVTAATQVPLLDTTSSKKRAKIQQSSHPNILPKGEKPIRLGSEDLEEQFHLSEGAKPAIQLLEQPKQ